MTVTKAFSVPATIYQRPDREHRTAQVLREASNASRSRKISARGKSLASVLDQKKRYRNCKWEFLAADGSGSHGISRQGTICLGRVIAPRCQRSFIDAVKKMMPSSSTRTPIGHQLPLRCHEYSVWLGIGISKEEKLRRFAHSAPGGSNSISGLGQIKRMLHHTIMVSFSSPSCSSRSCLPQHLLASFTKHRLCHHLTVPPLSVSPPFYDHTHSIL